MNNGNGVSRGDRNRNARLTKLRAAVPVTNAIVGIDLADKKQMVVVTDHDSKVLARRTFRCKAWDLGAALDWAAERGTRAGYAGVTVACEPTGHRWRVLGQLAGDRGMSFVCVQPMLTSGARQDEDLTTDKTDDKDAVLIARLTAQLRCYLPEPVDETWGRLRHLGCAPRAAPRRARRLRPADPRPARVRLARRGHHRPAAVQVPHLGRRDARDHDPRRRRLHPHPQAGPGPLRARRPQGAHPTREDPPLPADPAQPLSPPWPTRPA